MKGCINLFMKKNILKIVVLLFSINLFAQVASDPTDKFYTQVERWEALGIVETQPSLRPYPLPIINKILEQVINSSYENEAKAAKEIWTKVNGRPWGLILDTNGLVKKGSKTETRILANYGVDGDFSLLNFLSAGYELEFLTDVFPETNILPYNRYFGFSMADGYGTVKNYLEINGNLAANYNNWYFQAGINHNSFGPFYNESIVFSSNAKHTANFSISYNPGKWNYSQSFYGLSATKSGFRDGMQDKLTFYPNKFLFLHSLDWNITKWISVTAYETAIYGNRFDPAYLIPVPFMVTQGVTGYDEDNLLMGIAFNLKPIKGLTWSGDLYLDDIGFTGIKDYHDIKLHCAAQTGIKYVPEKLDFLKIIKLNYTMVTPYMYSHWQDSLNQLTGEFQNGTLSTINYQDYKNAGQKIGAFLEPNSDRVSLTAAFEPVNGLVIDLGASFARHANVTEGLSRAEKLSYLAAAEGDFTTDGSINQNVFHIDYENSTGDKKEYKYSESAWNKMMFLTQPTKEYCFQADIDIHYSFKESKIGRFTLGLGYTFEYIQNYGVGTDMLKAGILKPVYENDGLKSFLGYVKADGGSILSDSELDSILNDSINSWKATFTNLTNHYFRINFKYQF